MKKITALSFFLILLSIPHILFSQISPTPAAERLKGIEKRKVLDENSLVKNLKFRNVGPSIMSGRVTDIAVNDNDPTQFYVAYASGGLWFTQNNGLSFTPIFDNEDVMSIGAIAVDWVNNIIWVGTGEANSSRSSYSGIGIYKSTDNGKTWQYCGLPESQHIGKIILDAANKNIAYVAATGHLYSSNKERGVYKTIDGGKTWKQILFVDENTGAIDIAMDPKNNQVIYASMWYRERRAWNFTESGITSGIYKTTDGGTNWKLITGNNSGFPQTEGTGRIGIAIYRQNTNIIYASLDNQDHKPKEEKKDTSKISVDELKNISKENFLLLSDKKLTAFLKENEFPVKYSVKQIKDSVAAGKYKPSVLTDYLNDANNSLFDSPVKGLEIYRSNDGGNTWKKTHDMFLDDVVYTYGYYFGKIYVSPVNENKIYALGLPIITSDDGGKTFTSIDGENTHGDYHAVWIDPKNSSHLIIGNDGGINITYDDGKTWFKANDPPVGQFYSVAVDDAKPYNVYGGLQDNGVWYGPSTFVANSEWTQNGKYPYTSIYNGDGMQVQVDTRDNNTVYAGYQFGYYARINKITGEQKNIHPQNELGAPQLRFNWQTPIWLSKHNQDILYYGANKFFRSLDKGETLNALSNDLTTNPAQGDVPYGTITTISESPLKFGLIYCGTDDGNIQISKDDGYTWKKISGKLPQGLWVSRVIASAHNEATVYASLNGYRFDNFEPYLYVSNNFGDTWTQIGNDLPDEPINVVKEDTKNANIIYVGTDNGLYISINKGKTFMSFNGGLPRVAVHDIAIQQSENDIVLGTHGRSIYIANLKEVQMLNDTVLAKNIFIYPSPEINYFTELGNKGNFYSRPNADTILFPYYVKDRGITTVQILNNNSAVVKTITDTSEAGINYLRYDISIDSSAVGHFKTKLKDAGNNYEPKKADNGNYYLLPGKYKIKWTTAQGIETESEFEVTDTDVEKENASEKESE